MAMACCAAVQGPQHAAGGVPRFHRPQRIRRVAHTLPSARGNGEPLTGRFSPASGASFQALATGDNDTRFVLASVARLRLRHPLREPHRPQEGRQGDAVAHAEREGAAAGAGRRPARRIASSPSPTSATCSPSRCRELPELDKGKGNKLIDIPKAKLGTERVVAVAVVAPGATLVVKSGARTMSLSFKDLDAYVGARATRGGLLPRGWQKVEGLDVQ